MPMSSTCSFTTSPGTRVTKTLADEERSMEKEKEKVDRLKKKRPAASLSCDKDFTRTAVPQAMIRAREVGRVALNLSQRLPSEP